jgi:hypothetical protein
MSSILKESKIITNTNHEGACYHIYNNNEKLKITLKKPFKKLRFSPSLYYSILLR